MTVTRFGQGASASGGVDLNVWLYMNFPAAGTYFTLDDTTRGKLDNVTYKLYSSTAVDVAGDVTSIVVNRGNTSQLFPNINAGTCTIQLNNDKTSKNGARTYDPLHSGSPYFGNIVPGVRCVVWVGGAPIFDGRIDDWNFTYDVSGRSVAVINCVDAIGILGRQQLGNSDGSAVTFSAGQTTGQRVAAVLARPEVNMAANARVSTGFSVLQGDTAPFGTNVLQYLSQVVQSELGFLYCDVTGAIVFADRRTGVAAANGWSWSGGIPSPLPGVPTFSDTADPTTDVVGVGAGGAGYNAIDSPWPYSEIETQYGSEVLYNRITVNNSGYTATISMNLASQALYQVRTLSTPSLLLNSQTQMLDLGGWLLSRTAAPDYRVTGVGVNLGGQTQRRAKQMATGVDLMSAVFVQFTPNGTGAQVQRKAVIYGIRHEIGPAGYHITYSLNEIDLYAYFLLDNAGYGVLDTSTLSF